MSTRTRQEDRPLGRSQAAWAALATAVVLSLVAVGIPGCAKKLPVEPAKLGLVRYPEGTRGALERTPSDLIVWADIGVEVTEVWSDTTIPTRTIVHHRTGARAMQGVIVDYVQAGGYQVFRREYASPPDTGYRQFSDFTVWAARRWTDRIYYGAPQGTVVLAPAQLFAFSDPAPPLIPLKGYVGRAVLAGFSSADHPLTNLAEAPDTTVMPPLRYTGLTGLPRSPAPPDSLLDLSWEALPEAAGYWVHIYQKRNDIRGSGDAITVAQPSPIALGKVRDLFIGYFPAPMTRYKLGDPLPIGARVVVYRVLQALEEVLIRVSAVDARGRLIATTGSAGDIDRVQEKIGKIDRLRTFPLGAVKVKPGRPEPD